MATDTLRIGIIGAGANTRSRHIPGLRMQNSVEIVGVANRSLASSQKAAKELDIAKAYGDWTEMIADETIDAVCIGTWPYTHAEMTIAALDAGKHVLCEARMAMNAGEARAMLAASRRNPSRIAQIVPAPMTLPVDRTIADTIAGGAIGNVIAIDLCVSTGDYPNPDLPLHWRQSRDFSGNNVMALGIWYEQMARWVGHGASAFAVGQVVVKHRKDESGARVPITVPDHVDVTGQLPRGRDAHRFRYGCKIHGMDRRRDAVDARAARGAVAVALRHRGRFGLAGPPNPGSTSAERTSSGAGTCVLWSWVVALSVLPSPGVSRREAPMSLWSNEPRSPVPHPDGPEAFSRRTGATEPL
jgi:predicted dehydrogenase